MMKKIIMASASAMLFCIPVLGQQANTPADPQNTSAMEQRIRDLEDRVIALEGKLRTMESTQAASQQPPSSTNPQAGAPPQGAVAPTQAEAAQKAGTAQPGAQPPPVATAPAQLSPNEAQTEAVAAGGGQLPVYGGASAASKALNPDVSVIGDFIGAAGGNT